MTFNIDDLIEKSYSMPNVSVGGSPCYDFGEIVLVRYSGMLKYGGAREDTEIIAKKVNEKNNQGVRTPKYLAIKREVVNEVEFCWVVQEKAAGVSYKEYVCNNSTKQLEKQRIIANAPQSHFDNLIKDLVSLHYMGLELKPKNMFYDKNKRNGGFVIIDFVNGDYDKEFSGTYYEVMRLTAHHLMPIICRLQVTKYTDNATPEQIEESKKLHIEILKKSLIAMENYVPNFKDYKRFVLREFDTESLSLLELSGYQVGDLTLTTEEIEFLGNKIDDYLDNVLELLISGKKEYSDFIAHECFYALFLKNAVLYNPNPKLKRYNNEEEWDYSIRLEQYYMDKIRNKLESKIVSYVKGNPSCSKNIKQAYYAIKGNNRTL